MNQRTDNPAQWDLAHQAAWNRAHPWARKVWSARFNCSNPKAQRWSSIGGRGIRCSLTIKEAERLWKRDGAGDMNKPALRRRNVDGPYSFKNCRFREMRP